MQTLLQRFILLIRKPEKRIIGLDYSMILDIFQMKYLRVFWRTVKKYCEYSEPLLELEKTIKTSIFIVYILQSFIVHCTFIIDNS